MACRRRAGTECRYRWQQAGLPHLPKSCGSQGTWEGTGRRCIIDGCPVPCQLVNGRRPAPVSYSVCNDENCPSSRPPVLFAGNKRSYHMMAIGCHGASACYVMSAMRRALQVDVKWSC